jgi:hypothetical protein
MREQVVADRSGGFAISVEKSVDLPTWPSVLLGNARPSTACEFNIEATIRVAP